MVAAMVWLMMLMVVRGMALLAVVGGYRAQAVVVAGDSREHGAAVSRSDGAVAFPGKEIEEAVVRLLAVIMAGHVVVAMAVMHDPRCHLVLDAAYRHVVPRLWRRGIFRGIVLGRQFLLLRDLGAMGLLLLARHPQRLSPRVVLHNPRPVHLPPLLRELVENALGEVIACLPRRVHVPAQLEEAHGPVHGALVRAVLSVPRVARQQVALEL
mmetsp:Transcript_23895/g.57621  ORF Transcript_23895/g.57621 Transcript_23895/m.57621 type:complete len:211 (-) Transcript_23895:435-1067(-)